MQKRSASFFVVSFVAAVLSTGCAHKQETGTTTAQSEAPAAPQRQTSEVSVTGAKWEKVDSGPLTVMGVVGVGRFDGESLCVATAAPTCPNATSTDRGTTVFACIAGTCGAQNGGHVEAGKTLCCGATQGNGGKLRVSYTK